jgi:predicted AAA+ superfamily ATPase
MRELLGQIAKTLGSSMSLHSLAQNTQLMSYHTAQDYISILEQAFALRVLYSYDPEKDQFHFKKEKKFYFTDPIVYWAAYDLSGMKVPEDFESQLAEMVAAEWLFRRYKRLGYYSTREGEVDFMNDQKMAIEVKWSPQVHNLSKTYKNLRFVNKKVWHQNSFFELDWED